MLNLNTQLVLSFDMTFYGVFKIQKLATKGSRYLFVTVLISIHIVYLLGKSICLDVWCSEIGWISHIAS